MVLGGVKAVEKVGSFLLARDGRASNEGAVELPVTRYVIAEYLAVSVETVCCAIDDLQRRGIIARTGTRTFKILDRSALMGHARESCKLPAPV